MAPVKGCLNYDFALIHSMSNDKHVVADHQSPTIERFIPDHAEILAVQFPLGCKSGPGIAHGSLVTR